MRLETWSLRRLAREPVTRIIGRRGFWSFDLDVRPDVLDPRPDSERLIEVSLARFEATPARPPRVLDVGCGSGALIAALLLELPTATGVALDLSPAACAATASNLAALGLSRRCDVRLKDWRDEDEIGFDLVIANPPYIASGVIETLDPEVRKHDPRLALDGGADGLAAYRSICGLAPSWLRSGGLMVLEIGYDQGNAVRALVRSARFVEVELAEDLAGRPRVVSGKRI
jgi:release factor glutamine methyltransferase